jgi:hypothetical protein
MKPRKPIRRVSKAKAKSDRAYNKRVKEWLVDKWCAVYTWMPATQVHHQRGRAGSLKMDERFWIPVSAQGHGTIHAHPEWARDTKALLSDGRYLTLLCQIGEWNKPVK